MHTTTSIKCTCIQTNKQRDRLATWSVPLFRQTQNNIPEAKTNTSVRAQTCFIVDLLLFIKFAFKRTLLKQINSINTVLKQWKEEASKQEYTNKS